MRIYVTDRVTIEAGDRVLEESAFPRRQGRLAFAFLTLEHERPVPRDELADVLWPNGPPATWEKSLAAVLSKLRAALSAFGLDGSSMLVNAFGCYQLRLPDDAWIDIHAAADQVRDAEDALASGDLARAEAAAVVAEQIASSTFLAGDDGAWIDRVRARLRDISVRALDVMADARIGNGAPERAVEAAARAVEREPFRESSWLRLIRAHTARGDRAEALRAYERCRTVLAEELGVDPSPETESEFLRLLREGGPDDDAPRGDVIPRPLTSFIGRADVLASVVGLLERERLVTLTGSGGVGKTRLAVEAALVARTSFAEGAWMVDLGTVADPALVVERFATALGLGTTAATDGVKIASMLGDRAMLIVVDNCEHVLDACAPLLRDILERAHGPTVLATSRIPLGIGGEHVLRLASLADHDAVELFASRAAIARPDFVLGDVEAAAVTAICRRVDGIPLAIEMAAARTATMGVAEIAERLTDRFDVLTSGSASVPRQRTLHATLDWSYELLTAEQAAALRACSLFEGPFTLDDAIGVCGATAARDVTALVENSLLVAIESDGRTRYRALEVVKEYGRERMDEAGERATTIARYIDHFVGVLTALDAEPHDSTWLARAEQVREDCRAAIRFALEAGRDRDAVALGARMARYWATRVMLTEGQSVLGEVLDRARALGASADVASLLAGYGSVVYPQGDHRRAEELWNEALDVADRAGAPLVRARVEAALGTVAVLRTDGETAERFVHQAMEHAPNAPGILGRCHLILGALAGQRGNQEESKAHYSHAAAWFERAGAIGSAVNATVAMFAADDALSSEQVRRLHEAVGRAREARDPHAEAVALRIVGLDAVRRERIDDGLELFRDGLRVARRAGLALIELVMIAEIARLHARVGDALVAARLLAAWEAIRAAMVRSTPPHAETELHDAAIAAARARAATDEFEHAWRSGAAMSLGQAAAVAMDEAAVSS